MKHVVLTITFDVVDETTDSFLAELAEDARLQVLEPRRDIDGWTHTFDVSARVELLTRGAT